MMSQLGCVTLPTETIEAVYSGEKLSANEQALYDAHPSVAYGLLSKIPRLEPIAWMIEHQNQSVPKDGDPDMAEVRMGSQILRLILEYERLIQQRVSRTETVHRLNQKNPGFSPKFFEALVMLDPNAEEGEIQKCRIETLSPGLIIQDEIRTNEGELVVSKGQQVTPPLILKLKNLSARRLIGSDVSVSMPTTALAFVKGAS